MSEVSAQLDLTSLDEDAVPALPGGVNHLLTALVDPDIGFRELAAVVERHPPIAAKLMALANSGWSSPPSPITSLDKVCLRLGIGVVRGTSIALAVAHSFDVKGCPGFNLSVFWTAALVAAEAASQVAASAGTAVDVEPSTARAAGLLYSVGLLWLADQRPDLVAQAIADMANDNVVSLSAALKQSAGISVSEASCYLLQSWGLPRAIVEGIADSENPHASGDFRDLAMVLHAAVNLTRATHRGELEMSLNVTWDELGLDEARAETIFQSLLPRVADMSAQAEMLFG